MEIADTQSGEKWLLGIGESRSPVEIGYFEIANDQYHYHKEVYEYYLVSCGELTLVVEGEHVNLHQGNVCCIEPGEKHHVVHASDDLRCFIVKFPHLPDDKVVC